MGKKRPWRSADKKYQLALKMFRSGQLENYARMRDGRPILCTPTHEESTRLKILGKRPHKKKVIFDSLEKAEAWADIMVKDGMGRSRAYLCPRSKHGHAHLTSQLREEK